MICGPCALTNPRHRRAWVGCVLIDLLQRKHLISSRLEFEWTKNTVEYEALVLGLQKSIDLNVVVLKVVCDCEIMVRNTIHCVSPRLKSYQQELWRLISHFQAFNIISVPRMWKFLTLNSTAVTDLFLLLIFHNKLFTKPFSKHQNKFYCSCHIIA